MNWKEIEAQWVHMTARLKHHWLRLSDSDLKAIGGKRANLVSVVERRYGLARDEAERQVHDWSVRLPAPRTPPRSDPPKPPGTGVRSSDP